MTLLMLGLVLFLGVHSTRIVADGWRTATIARVGEKPWKGIYSLLSIAGFVLLAAAYVPGNAIKRAVGHPMMAVVKVWALAHLLANGTLADVLLFGTFLSWAVLGFIAARRRDRASGTTYPAGPGSRTAIAVVAGLVAWAVFAFALHRPLIGVAPFG